MFRFGSSVSRTRLFLVRVKNSRDYNVRKFLHKSKLRGSDENLRSTEGRKSGRKSYFKDRVGSSAKTRYDGDKVRISKLYMSLQSAIMESVMERCSNLERRYHTHFKSRENVNDIREIIRRRLDKHPSLEPENSEEFEFIRTCKRKEVKKNSNQDMKSKNQYQTGAFSGINGNGDDNDEIKINTGHYNKENDAKKGVNKTLLQNSKGMISAMAHPQSINVSDKLSKLDCLNYYKWNRTFVQNMKSVSPKLSSNVGINRKSKSGGIQSDANQIRSTEKCFNNSLNKGQSYAPSRVDGDPIYKNDLSFKSNACHSVTSKSSEPPEPIKEPLNDELVIDQKSEEKDLKFQNTFENLTKLIDSTQGTKDNEENVKKIQKPEIICLKDESCHAARCERNVITSSDTSIEEVDGMYSFEKSSAVTHKDFEHKNRELPIKSFSQSNSNHVDGKSHSTLKQNDTENTYEDSTCQTKLHTKNTQEDDQSLESKPTSKNIEKCGDQDNLLEESSSNPSKHLLDLIEFISGSKSQFSTVQKKLEMFGLHEEAEKVDMFSKAIYESLEHTILDDITSYLLGVQNSLLTYRSDSVRDQTEIPSITTTTDNVVSVLDKYLNKPENSEMNRNEQIVRTVNELDACCEKYLSKNKYKTSENVHQEECFERISDIEELSKGIVGHKLVISNSIKVGENNSNISNDREKRDIGEDFVKHSDKSIEGDQFETRVDKSEKENQFLEDGNQVAMFDQSVNNHSEGKPSSKYKNDLVEGLHSSMLESVITSTGTSNDEHVEENNGKDSMTNDKYSNIRKESSLKSEKIELGLISNDEQSEISTIDDKSSSGESPECDKGSHKEILNVDGGKASKLHNKKMLKAKTLSQPNYWKTLVNSYHTNKAIPWVIGKKLSMETTDVAWASQNSDTSKVNDIPKQFIETRESQIHDYGYKVHRLSNMVFKKPTIEKESVRSFNTCSKPLNILGRSNKSHKLELKIDRGDCEMENKRNDKTEDHQAIEVAAARREKKKLSIKELFPEKKTFQQPAEMDRSIKKEDTKLKVIGKKISPQEVVEAAEQLESIEKEDIKLEVIGKKISPQEVVVVEAAEQFLSTNQSPDVEGFDKSESISKNVKFIEKIDEMIMKGFGLSSKTSENSEEASLSNEADTLKLMQSVPNLKQEIHTGIVEADKNKSKECDKAHTGILQCTQNHDKCTKENPKNYQDEKQPNNN